MRWHAGHPTPYLTAIMERDGTVIARRVLVADTFWRRLRGLLGRELTAASAIRHGIGSPETGSHTVAEHDPDRDVADRLSGLLLTPCAGIHTCGLEDPIDLLFLSGAGTVVEIRYRLPPWRVVVHIRGAQQVLELPAGVAQACEVAIGERILLRPALGDRSDAP